MRIGIAIDVSTDVSPEFVASHDIVVLPSTIHMRDGPIVYDRDPARSREFYERHLAEHGLSSRTTPFSAEEIEQLFLGKLVLEYDYVFLITLMSTRSRTFENANRASFAILNRYAGARAALGLNGPFAMRVIDAETLFTGPGVLAWETARRIEEGWTPTQIHQRLQSLTPHLYSYVVPRDLYYIRERGRQRGDRSINAVAYWIGRALDIKPIVQGHRGDTGPVAKVRHFENAAASLFRHGADCIRKGLKVPMLGVSYAGNPAEVRSLPGYAELERTARDHDIELMLSMMSPAGAVNVGPGAVTLGYCGAAAAYGMH